MGSAMHHYRCVDICFPRTRAVQTYDTVTFFLHSISFSKVNLNDYLKQAAGDIIHHLTAPPSKIAPSLQAGDPIYNALLQKAKQLQWAQPLPDPEETEADPTLPLTRADLNLPPPRVSLNQLPKTRVDLNLPSPKVALNLLPKTRVDLNLPPPKIDLNVSPKKFPNTTNDAASTSPTIATLNPHSNKEKNQRFTPGTNHKHNLRSGQPKKATPSFYQL